MDDDPLTLARDLGAVAGDLDARAHRIDRLLAALTARSSDRTTNPGGDR